MTQLQKHHHTNTWDHEPGSLPLYTNTTHSKPLISPANSMPIMPQNPKSPFPRSLLNPETIMSDDADHPARLIPFASCSKSVHDTVNGTHVFVVKGYSLAKGLGAGRYISSDTFTVGGYDWAVYFYPDGKNPEDNAMYVSVFIALASDGIDVRALFKLEMKDQSEKGKDKVHSHFDRVKENGPYALKYRGSMWGFKRFYRRHQLELSDYLRHDCLEFHCTVGVVKCHVECPKQCVIHVPPSEMGQNLKKLLDDELASDIILKVGDETYNAHKLILAARSPVFKAQFFGLVGNMDLDTVVLEDVEPSVFKAMLLFIYTDDLREVEEMMASASSSSTIMVQHLLAAADRFGLDRLKLLCEEKLCEELATSNVAATLSLAEQHRCPQLKSVCLKFAATNLGDVMETEGFKDLELCCPSLLAELLEMVASIDEDARLPSSKKRSSRSIFGMDFSPDREPNGGCAQM